MPQKMIRQYHSHHRLAHGRCADADAGIVTALGRYLGIVAVGVDGAAGCQDRARGLDGETHDDVLAGGDAAEDAAGVVG